MREQTVAVSHKPTVGFEAEKDGKIRVNSNSFVDPVVLLPGEVL